MAVDLLQVLTVDEDILFHVLHLLDFSSLEALEETCSAWQVVFDEFGVWARVFKTYKNYLGYDWQQIIASKHSDASDEGYKNLLRRIENIENQWSSGPVRVNTISFDKEPVANVAMDELGLVVGLRIGKIQYYTRESWNLKWESSSYYHQKMTRLGLSSEYVFSGEACLVPGGPPLVQVWFRDTGCLARVLDFPGDHSINWIFPGLDNFVLFSHPFYDRNQAESPHRMFSGKISVFCLKDNQTVTSQTDLFQYSQNYFLSYNSLSSCKQKFLAYDMHKPESLFLIDMKTGSLNLKLPTSILGETMHTIEALQHGFITKTSVYIMYRNRSSLNGSIMMNIIDIGNLYEKPVITLTIEDTFLVSSMRTNWRVLMTSDRKKKRVQISPEGIIEVMDDPGLREASSCMETFADTVTIVHYIRKKLPERGYALVLQDFLPL